MYLYICIYIYIYICKSLRIGIYLYIHMYTYIYVYTHVHMHMYVYMHVYLYIYMYMNLHVRTYISHTTHSVFWVQHTNRVHTLTNIDIQTWKREFACVRINIDVCSQNYAFLVCTGLRTTYPYSSCRTSGHSRTAQSGNRRAHMEAKWTVRSSYSDGNTSSIIARDP